MQLTPFALMLFTSLAPVANRPEPPCIQWALNALGDSGCARYKQRMAVRLLDGKAYKVRLRLTRYSDDDSLDPGTGGGPHGCTWTDPDGKHKPDLHLRPGMVAADTRHWPTGTVLYAPPPWHTSWTVADCGPGVRGRDRADVYCRDRAAWNEFARNTEDSTGLTCWVLGRATHREVRGR